MARSAKKGTGLRDCTGLCADAVYAWWLGAVHVVGMIQNTSACCWLLLLSLEQRQLPIASVCEHQDDFSGLTCIGYRGISE